MACERTGTRLLSVAALAAALSGLAGVSLSAIGQISNEPDRPLTLQSIRGDVPPFGLFPGERVRICLPGLASVPISEISWTIRLVGPDGETGVVKRALVPVRGFRCVDVAYEELTLAGLLPEPSARLQVAARVTPVAGEWTNQVVDRSLPDGSFEIVDGQARTIVVGRFGVKTYDVSRQ